MEKYCFKYMKWNLGTPLSNVKTAKEYIFNLLGISI